MNTEIDIPDWLIQLNQYDTVIFFIMSIVGVFLIIHSLRMKCSECGFVVFLTGCSALILGGIGLIIFSLE